MKLGEAVRIAQVRSLSKHLLPHMPGFRQKDWLLYATPVQQVLRAFYFNRSGFDKETFYLYVFVMPLYVPAFHVHLSFGERIRCTAGETWKLSNSILIEELIDSVRREGLPFLERVREPSDLAALVQQLPGSANPPSLEAIAYSFVMADKYVFAQSALDSLAESLDVNIAWQAEMMERAQQIRLKLKADPEAAKQQLVEWAQATVKNLGV